MKVQVTPPEQLREEALALARTKIAECGGFVDLERGQHGKLVIELTLRAGQWRHVRVSVDATEEVGRNVEIS